MLRKVILAAILVLGVAGDVEVDAFPLRGGAVPGTGSDAMTAMLATMCSNCWQVVSTQGGQPSSDYEQVCFWKGQTDPNYPGTGAPDYNAIVANDNQQACEANTGLFEGVAYDSNANRFLIGTGGAHGSGYENSIIEFSFSTLKWRRLTTPDDSITLATNSGQNPVGVFAATGGIDLSDTSGVFNFPATMTITAMITGRIQIGSSVNWLAWRNATGDVNSVLFVASQLTNTDPTDYPNGGGPGTYSIWWSQNETSQVGNTPGLCSPTPSPSCNIPSGTNLYGPYSDDQDQSGQLWNGIMVHPACPNNITGPVGTHTYASLFWLPGWPDVKGSFVTTAFKAPYMMYYLNAINQANPLPSVANWQAPGRPVDANNLPTISNCSLTGGWHMGAGPYGNQSWGWSNFTSMTNNAGEGAYTAVIPGTTKIFQLSAGIGAGWNTILLYDPSKDPVLNGTTIPAPFLSQDNGTRPPGPPALSANPFTVLGGTGHSFAPNGNSGVAVVGTNFWLLGTYPVPANLGDYLGLRSLDMNTANATDYTPDPANTDNWGVGAYTPMSFYYAPANRIIELGTTASSVSGIVASATGTALTVTQLVSGNIPTGSAVQDVNNLIPGGTTIAGQVSSTEPGGALGGTGVYTLSGSGPASPTGSERMLINTGIAGITRDQSPGFSTLYPGVTSGGNIFDVINPTPNASGNISITQLVTGGVTMPLDMNFGGAGSGGQSRGAGWGRMVWDNVHKCIAVIGSANFIPPQFAPNAVWVYKPGPNFPNP